MIIIIDNYDSFTFNLYQAIAEKYNEVRIFRNDKVSIDDIEKLNPIGIIISPGPGKPEDAGIGVDLVKKLAAHIPMLGVCLGHQIITLAFGGKVRLAEHAVHGKDTYIFHHRSGIYKNMPLPFRAARYHSLIAEREHFPADLLVEAEGSDGMIMGIRHKDYPLYGVQFHPESILTPEGNLLLQNFIEICESYKQSAQHQRPIELKALC